MGSIYEGCLDNERTVYSYDFNNFKNMLTRALLEVQCNYACVDISQSVFYGARIVTYAGDVPECMTKHKNKWVFEEDKLRRTS